MSSRNLELGVTEQSWPLDKPFRIARGTRTEARVIVVKVSDGSTLAAVRQFHARGMVKPSLPPSPSWNKFFRKALSGLIDSRFKSYCPPVPPAMLWTARYGIWKRSSRANAHGNWRASKSSMQSKRRLRLVSTPRENGSGCQGEEMRSGPEAETRRRQSRSSAGEAVRQEAPAARLLVDANESWSPSHYRNIASALCRLGVELIEQPFPADADDVLETLDHPIPVCADESCHTTADLARLVNRYEAINVKLDKTGGLTEALLLTERARQSGFKLLIGCMVCTSLGIAPARLLAAVADYIDLDGPLLLAGDRHHGLSYHGGKIGMPSRELWAENSILQEKEVLPRAVIILSAPPHE